MAAPGSSVADTLGNIGKLSELRRRLLFTFGMLAVYRLGVAIPTPRSKPSNTT